MASKCHCRQSSFLEPSRLSSWIRTDTKCRILAFGEAIRGGCGLLDLGVGMHFAKALESLGTNPRASSLPAPGQFTHSPPNPGRGARHHGQDRSLHQKPVKSPPIQLRVPWHSHPGSSKGKCFVQCPQVPMDLKTQSVTKQASPSSQSVLDSGPPCLVT